MLAVPQAGDCERARQIERFSAQSVTAPTQRNRRAGDLARGTPATNCAAPKVVPKVTAQSFRRALCRSEKRCDYAALRAARFLRLRGGPRRVELRVRSRLPLGPHALPAGDRWRRF